MPSAQNRMDYLSRRPNYITPCSDFDNINVTFKGHIDPIRIKKCFEQLYPYTCNIQNGDQIGHYDHWDPGMGGLACDLDPTKDWHFIPEPRGSRNKT